MKKFVLLSTALVLVCSGLWAQGHRLTGNVASSSGEPVSGATVVVRENPSVGTTTDANGNFTLPDVRSGQTVTVSFVGYLTFEKVIEPGITSLFAVLEEDVKLVDEIVVVGYGSQRRADVTGSVSSVSGENLRTGIPSSMDQMLNGKVSGVTVTQNSGAPGAASSIRVRGTASITGGNEPLYVIDGIPFQTSGNTIGGFDWAGGTNGQTTVNPLASIAPSDIVSIDILKDASATAIYGANGGNGVVLVTTRRGQKGRTHLNYDGYVAVQQIANKLDMMDLRQYARYQNQLGADLGLEVDEAYADPSLLGKGTDWQNEIFRAGLQHSHQLSVTGGGENVQFALSGGYMNQEGTVIGSDFERFNGRANIDATIKPWLKAGGSFSFTRTNQTITNNDGTDGVILQALTMQPSIPVYGFDGEWAGPETVNGASQYNPVWLAQMKNNLFEKNQTTGNFYLSFDIFKDLNFRSEYGFDFSDNVNMCFAPTYSFGVISSNINQIMQREEHSSYWISKNYATYNKTFADKHRLSVMAGFEASGSAWKGNQIIKKNLSNNDIHVVTEDGELASNNGWKDGATMASGFARLNYNYDERYLLTATFRADGSSKFGANNKWGYFPSVALAWRISREAFLRDSRVVSNLKLRLGYGQVGNSNIGTYLYGSKMSTMTTPFGTAYYMSNIANPNLKWEASEQYNIGIDLGLARDRVNLTVDLYQKNSKDLLLQVSVPSYLGGTTDYDDIATPMANIGQTLNRGIDISLNTRNIVRPDFSWTSDLNISVNRNKVVALNDNSQRIYQNVDWWSEFQTATVTMVGKPIGVFYGYVADGIFQNEEGILNSAVQVADPSNKDINLINKNTGVYPGDIKFRDLNDDGAIDSDDQKVIGDPNPDFTFGFTNTFNYKNWSLGITLTGSYGGDILAFYRYRTEGMTSIWDNQSTAVMNRAMVTLDDSAKAYVTNPGAALPRAITTDPNRNNRMSTRYIEDGSYLRVQNISLAYDFPQKWCGRIGLSNIKMYFNVQNVCTITGYSGYDPEIGSYNQNSLLQNIDRGRYPTPRMYTFGLNFGF